MTGFFKQIKILPQTHMWTVPDLFLFLFLVALVRLPKLSYLPRGFACEQRGGISLEGGPRGIAL